MACSFWKIVAKSFYGVFLSVFLLINAPAFAYDDFSVVLLPDTQYYTDDDIGTPATYCQQMYWIIDAAGYGSDDDVTDRDLEFVIHLGDITDDNTTTEWARARYAHNFLDTYSIPYSVAYGNHDIVDRSADSNQQMAYRLTDLFNDNFGPDWFDDKSWYVENYPSGTNNNSCCIFEIDDDLKFMVLSLEYAPKKDTLAWAANRLIEYQDYWVIVVTHGYLGTYMPTDSNGDPDYFDDDGDPQYRPAYINLTKSHNLVGSDGLTLWDELISRFNNIFMVVCGHAPGDCVRERTGLMGNTVYEVLVDFQFETKSGTRNGNGWLKTLEFSPNNSTIEMAAVSATGTTAFNQTDDYPSNKNLEYHKYTIEGFDMLNKPAFEYEDELIGFNDRDINNYSSHQQLEPEVAAAGNGDFVAVWKSNARNSSEYDIKIRGFNVDGTQKFSERRVDSTSSYYTCKNPDVAVNEFGDVVVVWEEVSNSSYFDAYLIRAKGYSIDGSVSFSPITIFSSYDGRIGDPAVDIDSDGNFVVVWEDDNDDNKYYQIRMKGLDADGDTRFGPSTVNYVADGQQRNPDVAVAPGGGFVVVFEDDQDKNGYYEILMRGFYSSGSQRFAQKTVNATSTGQQYIPKVAIADSGKFAVTWQDGRAGDGDYDVYTRGFYYGGSQLFSERRVNYSTTGNHLVPKIAMSADGDFGITWRDDTDDNGCYQIYARVYSISGGTILGQKLINKDESGTQKSPAISIDDDYGSIVVVWTDDIDGNDAFEILGRGSDEDYSFRGYD